MKRSLYFFLLCLFCATALYGAVTPKGSKKQIVVANELSVLDNLIEVSKQNLESQKKLRELIQQYQNLQSIYLKNEQDKEVLYKIVRVAYLISESIKENHLAQIFDPDFLSELNLFAQIAQKRG